MCGQHVKLLDSVARQMGDEFIIDNKSTAPPACASNPNFACCIASVHSPINAERMHSTCISLHNAEYQFQSIHSRLLLTLQLLAAAGARRTWWPMCSGASRRAAPSRCSKIAALQEPLACEHQSSCCDVAFTVRRCCAPCCAAAGCCRGTGWKSHSASTPGSPSQTTRSRCGGAPAPASPSLGCRQHACDDAAGTGGRGS
jgi:hypothetical protein